MIGRFDLVGQEEEGDEGVNVTGFEDEDARPDDIPFSDISKEIYEAIEDEE